MPFGYISDAVTLSETSQILAIEQQHKSLISMAQHSRWSANSAQSDFNVTTMSDGDPQSISGG